MEKHNAQMKEQSARMESQTARLKEQYKELNIQEEATNKEVARLRGSGVAFTASLSDTPYEAGSFEYPAGATMIFSRVLTNVGEAYNPAKGIFTAPVKGVYHFGLHIHAHDGNAIMARLQRNSKQIVAMYEINRKSRATAASTSAILVLEAGDEVYVEQDVVMVDTHDDNIFTVFDGHLIFTL